MTKPRKLPKLKAVICQNHFLDRTCGWVSFEVSREFAESQVKSFNDYFAKLSKKEQKDNYGGKGASISHYDRCFRCSGSYKNFRKAKDSEIPMGSTMQGIISKKD